MTMRYNDADESLLFRAGGTDAGKLMDEPCCSNKNNCTPPLRCRYNVTLADLVGELAEWNGAHVVAYQQLQTGIYPDEHWFLWLRTGMHPAWLDLWWYPGSPIQDAGWLCSVTENLSGGGQAGCSWYLDAGECAPTGSYVFYNGDGYEDSTAVVS